VAGIVGELLTDLFLLAEPRLEAVATELRANAALFGEGLQLVNVLKDRRHDLADGRSFVPSSVEPSALFALARHDLVHASHYVEALVRSGASRGTVAFTTLPLRLAGETLDRIEADGPGAKLSRARVAEIYAELTANMDR
jgi:farnesyl-diphosphate farnesyltransferase